VKPGYTTTEFWLTLLTQLSAVLTVIHPGFDISGYVQGASVVLAGLAQIIYASQRSTAKGRHLAKGTE
jgi:hypothetical protein